MSRFQRNILYFLIITIILVIFYLLPGDNKNGVLDESDYNNIEVVQDTLKYEKVQLIQYKWDLYQRRNIFLYYIVSLKIK